jgi:putative endonuclease
VVRLIAFGTETARDRDVLRQTREESARSFAPVSQTDPRQQLGRLGERLAAEHLERLGYTIVTRNHRTRFGEIDLVATDGRVLVFVEVKTRRGRGQPWDALHEAKRAQVRRMARAYLTDALARPRVRLLRFDAIGVVVDAHGRLTRLEHIEDAF